IGSIGVEVVGKLPRAVEVRLAPAAGPLKARSTTQSWFNGNAVETYVYVCETLREDHTIAGHAIVCDVGSTVWIEPAVQATVRENGELLITGQFSVEIKESAATHEETADPVLLEIFNNQFASIAEQMGVTLRKTSISTNVKERLDYSCAVF